MRGPEDLLPDDYKTGQRPGRQIATLGLVPRHKAELRE